MIDSAILHGRKKIMFWKWRVPVAVLISFLSQNY